MQNKPVKNKSRTRRAFIKEASFSSLGLIAVPGIIPSIRKGANDKVNVGFIGTGNHGVRRNLSNYVKINDCRVVALCDVDSKRLEDAKQIVNEAYGNKDVDVYGDFRELLLRKDIDAIQISTPDHWHVYQSIASLRAGKHVCCEKPTRTIHEGRILAEQVNQQGKIFQTSIEDRFLEPYYRLAKLVREGRIGTLKRIRVGLPGINRIGGSDDFTTQPVPSHFNYDMWLGPAPEAPYSPGRCHFNFRWFDDYAGGSLADWGAHLIDTAQLCNHAETWGPVEVVGKGTRPSEGIFDAFEHYNLTYRYENGVDMEVHGEFVEIYCEGTDGWLKVIQWNKDLEASSPDLLVVEKGEAISAVRDINEHVNFIRCIKNGEEAVHPAEDMHRTATVAHIGNIAMELGRKLQWDPKNEEFIDDDEANKMRSRKEREPWTLQQLLKS